MCDLVCDAARFEPLAMPPKSAGAARRARKAKTKQALEEQGQSRPGYVDNPARPSHGRQDRQTRRAIRSFNEQEGLELDPGVQRRPAGNQPSHFAKARSAVEVCPSQRVVAAPAPSEVEAGFAKARSAVEACPPLESPTSNIVEVGRTSMQHGGVCTVEVGPSSRAPELICGLGDPEL